MASTQFNFMPVAIKPGSSAFSRFEYLKKSARNFGTVLLGIETPTPENFTSLSERLEAVGMSIRDITGDEAMIDLII